jgi:hypothetical protein
MDTVKGSISLKAAAAAAGVSDSLVGAAIGELGLKQAEHTRARRIPKKNTGFEDFIKNSLDNSRAEDERKRPLTAWKDRKKNGL